MSIKETSFIKRAINSIKNIEKYAEMATNSNISIFKYFMQLVAIIALCATIVSVCTLYNSLNKRKLIYKKWDA